MKKQERRPISEWAEEDRPREKLLLKGIAALSDAELLAILIGSGNCRESAVELAQRILYDANNNINILGKMSVKELISSYKGIGQDKGTYPRRGDRFTRAFIISRNCGIYSGAA